MTVSSRRQGLCSSWPVLVPGGSSFCSVLERIADFISGWCRGSETRRVLAPIDCGGYNSWLLELFIAQFDVRMGPLLFISTSSGIRGTPSTGHIMAVPLIPLDVL